MNTNEPAVGLPDETFEQKQARLQSAYQASRAAWMKYVADERAAWQAFDAAQRSARRMAGLPADASAIDLALDPPITNM